MNRTDKERGFGMKLCRTHANTNCVVATNPDTLKMESGKHESVACAVCGILVHLLGS